MLIFQARNKKRKKDSSVNKERKKEQIYISSKKERKTHM